MAKKSFWLSRSNVIGLLAASAFAAGLYAASASAAAKADPADPTELSYTLLPHLTGNAAVELTAPSGRKMLCTPGNDKRNTKRVCRWE